MRTSTFTSFINVEPDQAIDAKFANLERQAQASFSKIASFASKANQQINSAGKGGALGGAPGNSAQMQAQARALREVARENQRVSTEVARTSQRMNENALATSRAKREMGGFERTLRTTATTLNVVQGPLGPIAGRIGALASAVSELTGLRLGIAGTGAALFALTSQANKYTEIRSKLVPLYESQNDVNRAMRDTVRIAEAARTSLSPVVDLYARLTIAGRDAGLSQQRTSRLTEIAAKAAKLSGGMQVSQEAGLYQFSQGIGSGILGGDELKSVRENTLRLAKAIADGLGVPMAELKKLGKEGKLTPKVIADALEKESARIDAELERLPETLSSASAKFTNALTMMVGESDQALGFTTALAEGLAFLAKNLGPVTNGVIGLATAFAVFKSGSYVADVARRIEASQKLRQEAIAGANAEVKAAGDIRKANQLRIAQLRSVRTELRQQIEAERAVRNEAVQTARSAQTANARRGGLGLDASAIQTRRYAEAMETARRATANLNDMQGRLRQVTGELSNVTAVSTQNTSRFRTAQVAAATASKSLGRGIIGLIGAINPLGIALSLGISYLIQFAFRQDAAAAAADKMADREANLGRFIDLNTGKIIEQNKALIANERLKARETAEAALDAYKTESAGLKAGTPQGYLGIFKKRLPDAGQAEISRYRKGEINAATLAGRLEALRAKETDPGRQRAYDRSIANAAGTVSAARVSQQADAYSRLLAGKAQPGDLELAKGTGYVDPSGKDIPGAAAGGGGGTDKEKKSRSGLAAASKAAAAAERELQQALDRTDKRSDILSRYDETPKAMDRAAKDARELGQLIGQTMNGIAAITKENPLGKGIYTAEMASADSARIEYGVRKPIRDLLRDQERGIELSKLRADGYEDEANALDRALQIQDDIGRVTREEYAQILENERAQQRINDVMEARGRITSLILNQVQESRDIVEGVLLGDTSIVGGIKQAMRNVATIQVRKFTETLFAGADEKVRELLRTGSGMEKATDILEKNATASGTALGEFNTEIKKTTAVLRQVQGDLAGGGLGPVSTTAGTTSVTANTVKNATAKGTASGLASALKGVSAGGAAFSLLGGFGGYSAANDNAKVTKIPIPSGDEIVVTGTRAVSRASRVGKAAGLPSGAEVYNKIGEAVGGKLDAALGTKFFKGIGGSLGTALQGAGTGVAASGFAKALGLKQSTTGAAVGGAIGNFIPGLPPGVGSAIGGLLGGTLGGLLKKTKTGSATIGAGAFGGLDVTGTSGNSSSYKKVAEGLAGGVIDSVSSIAQALGGTLTSAGGVSIGQRKKSFVVDTTGRGKTKGAGTVKFDSEEEAAAYATKKLIEQGVIGGISAASQNILKSGKDLQKSVEKAAVIESIPKRLMQLQDPVRYAITELNTEFALMISYLKEGGATAAQFADAQKLYDLERARAIEQATQQSVAALQAYLDEMVGGASSPLNKGTVYNNASAKFGSSVADFKAGKIDQNELLTATKNFQDASRALFGSGSSFFADFETIQTQLKAAMAAIGGTSAGGELPGSPFASDTSVQNAIASLNGTTAQQTATLNASLQQILAALQGANDNGTGSGVGTGGSSMYLLPGVSGAALDRALTRVR